MSIELNINTIRNNIVRTLALMSQSDKTVTVIAASKTQPITAIRQAYDAGIRDFGENYWQEAQRKIMALPDLSLCWHMIGDVQANKARVVAEHFSWVHTVSRDKIAERLNQYRPAGMPPLNICIEVNVDQESTKAGISPQELAAFANRCLQFPRLTLRGLMCIPRAEHSEEAFKRLAQYQQELNQAGMHLDTLSMGMSADYLAAIRAGATMVRIGTGIFGARSK